MAVLDGSCRWGQITEIFDHGGLTQCIWPTVPWTSNAARGPAGLFLVCFELAGWCCPGGSIRRPVVVLYRGEHSKCLASADTYEGAGEQEDNGRPYSPQGGSCPQMVASLCRLRLVLRLYRHPCSGLLRFLAISVGLRRIRSWSCGGRRPILGKKVLCPYF